MYGRPDMNYTFLKKATLLVARSTRWRNGGIALQARRSWYRFPVLSLRFFIYVIFRSHYVSGLSTETGTRDISWGKKVGGGYDWQSYHLHVQIVLKSGNLNLLDPLGPLLACKGLFEHFLVSREILYFPCRLHCSSSFRYFIFHAECIVVHSSDTLFSMQTAL